MWYYKTMSKSQYYATLHDAVTRHVSSAAKSNEMEKFLRTIMHVESTGSLTAQNKNSSAGGLFQFTDGTWYELWKQNGTIPSKYKVEPQCDAAVRYALENAKEIKNEMHWNRDLTAGEYYLGHFAGSTQAVKVLKALEHEPNTPISKLLTGKSISANAQIEFRGKRFAQFTADDLMDWANAKMNVNIDARVEYQKLHDEGKTTKEQDEAEKKERKRILLDYGMSEKAVNGLDGVSGFIQDVGGILSKLFLSILSLFMDKAATTEERDASPSAASTKENYNTIEPPKYIAPKKLALPIILPSAVPAR